MFAYCDNNPVNYSDSTGEKMVQTLEEYQNDLTNGDVSSYCIMDITLLQQQGYSNNDRILQKNNGKLVGYNTGYQIWDSFVAVYNSVNMDLGVGFGIGGGVGIKGLAELQGVIKYDPFSVHADIDGYKFGQKIAAEASASIGIWDIASIGGEDFYPYKSGELESTIQTSGIGISFGAYAVIGFDVSFYWNFDYISTNWSAIW